MPGFGLFLNWSFEYPRSFETFSQPEENRERVKDLAIKALCSARDSPYSLSGTSQKPSEIFFLYQIHMSVSVQKKM